MRKLSLIRGSNKATQDLLALRKAKDLTPHPGSARHSHSYQAPTGDPRSETEVARNGKEISMLIFGLEGSVDHST